MIGRGPDRFAVREVSLRDEISLFVDFHHRAHVVQQGVEPDVCHVVFVKGQGDSPAEARLGPADAQVVQRLLQESADFVPSVVRDNPVPVSFQVFDESFLVFSHLEEVVLFLDPIDRAVADGVASVFVEFVQRK